MTNKKSHYNYSIIHYLETGQGNIIWTEAMEDVGQFDIVDNEEFKIFCKVARSLGYDLVDHKYDE